MTNGQCERFNKTILDMLGTLHLDKIGGLEISLKCNDFCI